MMKMAISNMLQELPAKLCVGVDPAYAVCGQESLASLLARGEPSGAAVGGGEALVVRHRWQDAVIEQMVPPGASVLDLGCGAGVPTTQELAQCFRVTGVDISARQVALAQQNIPVPLDSCT